MHSQKEMCFIRQKKCNALILHSHINVQYEVIKICGCCCIYLHSMYTQPCTSKFNLKLNSIPYILFSSFQRNQAFGSQCSNPNLKKRRHRNNSAGLTEGGEGNNSTDGWQRQRKEERCMTGDFIDLIVAEISSTGFWEYTQQRILIICGNLLLRRNEKIDNQKRDACCIVKYREEVTKRVWHNFNYRI